MKDRTGKILALLNQHSRIAVAALSEELHVSQVTIRKDLDLLEKIGLIAREHGYALLLSQDDLRSRLAYHYEEKTKIAQKAAELIRDGETVMIESGSCCAILALVLAQTKKNLTIVTNSAFIADHIRNKADTGTQIVLLGGIYQAVSQCLVGPMISDGAAHYNVKHFFVGVDGFSPERGFANKDQMRSQAVRDMARSCDRIIFLSESEKFSDPGTVPLQIRDKKQAVITDSRLSREAAASMEKLGIEIIRA